MVLRHACAFLALLVTAPAWAQTAMSLGVINPDPSAPVEVDAKKLTVDRNTGIATFSGDVVAIQAGMRLATPRLNVTYDEATREITTLEAFDGVIFVTATEEAEADHALYHLSDNMLYLDGNVLITQGSQIIVSDKMEVDLATGQAEMTGNVRTVFGDAQ